MKFIGQSFQKVGAGAGQRQTDMLTDATVPITTPHSVLVIN